jgi:hypothetical protein
METSASFEARSAPSPYSTHLMAPLLFDCNRVNSFLFQVSSSPFPLTPSSAERVSRETRNQKPETRIMLQLVFLV